MQSATTTLYCGIDVSCDTLDACYQSTDLSLHHCKVSNDLKGYRQLLKQTGGNYHFVMEATGVYHISFVFFLHQRRRSFSVVNALQIKRYIKCILSVIRPIRKMLKEYVNMVLIENLKLL